MEYLSADKILVIDLNTSEIEEKELEEELAAEKIGGVGITKHLYQQYEADDPLVLGVGLLTGTLYPAAAAGVITAKSPVTGTVCHCPITIKVGVEMQYSGFDYIVVKGASEKPVFLWIHDGVADIADAADVWGQDVWQTTDAWRRELGDDLIQTLVIGPMGENGSELAQICQNHWGSGDYWGFGALLGRKNVKGVAFRGMGLLEIADPEEFVEECLELLEDVKAGAHAGKKGVAEICAAMGETDVPSWLEPLVHRHSACYNTPFASNTFVFLDERPDKLEEPDIEEPGFLITDIYGLLGFKKLGLSAEEACRLLKYCARQGADPKAVAELSAKAGKNSMDDIQDALPELTGKTAMAAKGPFSPWCPQQPLMGDFELSGDTAAWWERRQAVAYIFGVHPIFAVMAPELSEESMLELANIGTDLDLDQDTLNEVVNFVCG